MKHLPYLLAVLLIVVVATWPLAAVVGTHAVGHPYGDMPDHYWGTWWFGRRILAGQLPLATDVSHFPEALALWYVDPVGALAALPLRLFGFPAAWNLLLFGQVTFAALAGYAVGVDATEDRASGLVSAAVIGASPFLLGLLHSGLSEFIGLGPVTLYVWMLLRAVGHDPRGRPAPPRAARLAAGLLGACGLGSVYYLLFGGLVALAALPGPGWRTRAPTLMAILAGGAAITAPFALATLSTLDGDGAITADNAPGWASRLPATDLLTFFRPGAYYFPDTPAHGNPGILHVTYLGWVALALAACGASGALRRAGLWFAAFALGPRLAVAKQIVTIAGASVLLPFGVLCFPGSPFAWIHQPYRMVAFLLPFLAIAAAMGAARLPVWTRPLLALCVLTEAITVSPASWPLATRDMTPPAHLAQLTGPTLDWPPDGSTANRDYLLWATQHGQAVPYGVNVFLRDALRADPLVDGLLRALRHVERRARNRDVPFGGRVLGRPRGTETRLAELGFRHVVVHEGALDAGERARTRALLDAFGEPAYSDAGVTVWTVR